LFQFFVLSGKEVTFMSKKRENYAFIPIDKRNKRKFWLSDDGLALIAGWTREGHTIKVIADKMGVGKSTLYEWMNDSVELADTLQRNLEICNNRVISALYQKCLDGDTNAIKYWLANRAAKDWRDKQELVIDGDIPVVLKDNVTK